MAQESFPRLSARTQRFTLGRPRSFAISADGQRVLFVRSMHGTDPVARLWKFDMETGVETLLADPDALIAGASEELTKEERARRERMRESASGVVSFSIDDNAQTACFALSGRLFVVDIDSGKAREFSTRGSVIDPRLSPSGAHVAFVTSGSLRVIDIASGEEQTIASSTEPGVVFGLADFIAAEELDRARGHWWSPQSDHLLVERYDESGVSEWFISNPTDPTAHAVAHRYPAAGAANARVELWLYSLDGSGVPVQWDLTAWEYVSAVHWSERGQPLIQVLDRQQRTAAVLSLDINSGVTEEIHRQEDIRWVDVKTGVPCWSSAGDLLTIEVVGDTYTLCENGKPLTPPGLQVDAVVAVDGTDIVLHASESPTEQHLYICSPGGTRQLTRDSGVHAGLQRKGTLVTTSAALGTPETITRVRSKSREQELATVAANPNLRPNVTILPADPGELRIAVVLPETGLAAGKTLPVLLDPYGGPHAQRVLSAEGAYRESQWFADQGFGVVVVDGRGTPGSPSWERAIAEDLAAVVLEDQVQGLQIAANAFPGLDTSRVGIRGWSFGGFLAALALLERPDVFHAAVAGAPVTDWRLYDTGYTERYLGTPQQNPNGYASASLLGRAASLRRPLLLIHGFSDDNVVVAHTMQLSQELLEHGRSHSVLPLTGITHMTSQEAVAENLMLLQVEFLTQHLVRDDRRA